MGETHRVFRQRVALLGEDQLRWVDGSHRVCQYVHPSFTATPWNSGGDSYPMGSLSRSAWVDVLRIPWYGWPVRFVCELPLWEWWEGGIWLEDREAEGSWGLVQC